MLPIVTALVSQGLSLLGNVVLTKGKEFVEEKTGVKLTDTLSSADLLRLKQFELSHEEELIRLRQEDDRLDFALLELEEKNQESARTREVELAKTPNAPYLSKVIVPVLALIITIGGGGIFAFTPNSDVRMGILSLITTVLGYYFGTSYSSSGKDKTINLLASGDFK
jgi:hypothetical protein